MSARPNVNDVFLNLAFDRPREYLYLSLIASLVGLGLNPRTVLEVPVDAHRLDRLRRLIRACRYSIHDMSAVQVTVNPHRCPRFNMPFELGMAVAIHLEATSRHSFRVLEQVNYRMQQSLSDLNGYDPFIHGGHPTGVFDAIRNMFATLNDPPMETTEDFQFVYGSLRRYRRSRLGRGSVYTATQFGSLVTVARGAVEARVRSRVEASR